MAMVHAQHWKSVIVFQINGQAPIVTLQFVMAQLVQLVAPIMVLV